MKNKGFTLVELLGVIVVLAILALITIPIISNVITNVRIKSLENSAYGLIEASNLYYAQNGSNNIRFDINDNKVSSKDTDKLLSYKGSIKSGTVILDKTGKVTICITDGKNSAYKNYNENKVTIKNNQTCYINDNSNIVYLSEDGATITQYDNQKLTELVNALINRVDNLESENNTLKNNNSNLSQQMTNLSSDLSETKSSMLSLNDVYPIGSIYITTTEDTVAKVRAKLGGTWVAYGAGKTLVGVDTSQTEFNTVEKTGGEKTHTLTVEEMPRHNHIIQGYKYNNGTYGNYNASTGLPGTTYPSDLGTTSSIGADQPHNNLQPYITVYMYKRTA